MAIYENLVQFAGRAVEDWDATVGIGNPHATAYRLRVSYEAEEEASVWADELASLLADPKVGELEALVVGAWGEVAGGDSSAPVVEALAAARDKLRGLRHLFFGDITMEESEISWINQSDVSPLLEAYPQLEHLTIRGGQSFSLGSPRHAGLRELVIQAGGLPAQVLREIAAGDLPDLEHLELWLGEEDYGGDATIDDVTPLLKGDRFPRLKFLGLKNSEIQDEIAAAVARSPVLARLEVLDLSMGTLGDDGARALLASPAAQDLEKLDIHHHFVSEELVEALERLGIEVNADDPQTPHEFRGESHRFVAVGE
jgi:hypothetical protein